MRFDSIRLTNFRGFSRHEESLDPEVTVFVGDNGAGKTAIIEGLAYGLEWLVGEVVPGGEAPLLLDGDVRRVTYEHKGLPDLQHQYPVELAWTGEAFGQAGTWALHRDANTEVGQSLPGGFGSSVRDQVQDGKPIDLPVAAVYRTGRLLNSSLVSSDKKYVGSRWDGYAGLGGRTAQTGLEAWMRKQALVAAQRGEYVPHVAAVERAVLDCLGGDAGRRFYYDLAHEELRLEFGDSLVAFHMLSDGYRSTLAMAADLAWRAVVLNPQHGDMAPRLTSGVVLVDEIDLHLHPRWQRRILGDLRRAFPRFQFVVTTHSPFIVQSLEAGQLRNLDPDADPAAEYAGRSPEDVVEGVMGVSLPQRSHRFERMHRAASEYYAALRKGAEANDLTELRRELDRLKAPFEGDAAFVALLEAETAAALGDRK